VAESGRVRSNIETTRPLAVDGFGGVIHLKMQHKTGTRFTVRAGASLPTARYLRALSLPAPSARGSRRHAWT
jgi:hypothetical protein